jgi:hypothetical protein
MKIQTMFEMFCCSLQYTHDMEVNVGYVIIYGMFRFVTKVDMILMSRYLVMIYVSFMLD